MRRPTAIKLAASVGGVVACYTWKFDKNQSLCSAETVSYEWQNDWDNKQNLYDSKKKIGTHYIVLIRHGQYEERQDLDEDRKLTGRSFIFIHNNIH